MPLFGEIDLFGLKLKKEIEEVKNEMSRITNKLSNQNTFNPTIIYQPSNDKTLEKELNQVTPKTNLKSESYFTNVDENMVFLFKVRVSIEKELRRIFTEHSEFSNNEIRFENVSNFLGNLKAKELIQGKLFGAIRELIAISNLGIHGEEVTEKQQEFSKKFFPIVMNELKKI